MYKTHKTLQITFLFVPQFVLQHNFHQCFYTKVPTYENQAITQHGCKNATSFFYMLLHSFCPLDNQADKRKSDKNCVLRTATYKIFSLAYPHDYH